MIDINEWPNLNIVFKNLNTSRSYVKIWISETIRSLCYNIQTDKVKIIVPNWNLEVSINYICIRGPKLQL